MDAEPTGAGPDEPTSSAAVATTGSAAAPSMAAAFAMFDGLTDLVVVLDDTFQIVYANRFALDLLGYEATTVVGRSITEFLNAEDIVRAFEVVALMADDRVGVAVTPALYDLRRSDGSSIPVELNAVTPPAGIPDNCTLVIGRYSGDHDLQNRILEMITADSHDADLIALVPRFGTWRHPDEQYAVLYDDIDGNTQATGTPQVLALVADHPDEAPWAMARRTHQELLVPRAELDAALRADAAGLADCWVVPVDDPLHDQPAVLIGWSREDGPPASVHRYVLEIMGRMLDLILQWRRQREELERAARRDPLTSVVNRAGFFEALTATLAEGAPDAMVGLLYVDLDGFKDINDGHGHSVGDDVLRVIAARLASAMRLGDRIGRLGGDEFAVLCPTVHGIEDLTAVAERIIADISQPISVRGVELRVGASIGIATSRDATDPDQLVDTADRALYLAKAAGRGRWHIAGSDPSGDDGPLPPHHPSWRAAPDLPFPAED